MANFLHDKYKNISTEMCMKLLVEAKSEYNALPEHQEYNLDMGGENPSIMTSNVGDKKKHIKNQNAELLQEYNFRKTEEDSNWKNITWEEIQA